MRPDAPSGADKAGTRAYRPRPSRIRDRMYLRSADIAPPLRAADERGSAHVSAPKRRVCRRAQLACRKPLIR